MQILVMLLFLAVWLLILWSGSVALEATGMKRTKARFQALSALTGTGFTTTEAESVVEHPKRRQIVTYLIFIGNAGIIAFIILLVLYVRAGLTAPSTFLIAITIAVLLILSLAFWLGLIDKMTNGILGLIRKGSAAPHLIAEETLYQAGNYAVVRLAVREHAKVAGLKLKDTVFQEPAITILAIERGDDILSYPSSEESLLIGDYLLCYGKLVEISKVTRE